MAIAAALALGSLGVWFAGMMAFNAAAERAFARGRAEAQRYATLLITEFHRFDYLPELLLLHPAVQSVLRDPTSQAVIDAANRYLESVNTAAGASNLYLMDVTGRAIATSNWREPTSYLGVDFSFRPYFTNALVKKEDRFYGVGSVSGVPGYFFAKALTRDSGTIGIGVVKVNLENLGIHRSSSIREFMIVDEKGVIVLSSRPSFLYRAIGEIAPDILKAIKVARQYADVTPTPIGLKTEKVFADGSIVTIPGESGEQPKAQFLAQDVPFGASNWKIVVLSDLSEVMSFKYWMQAVTTLVATSFLFFVMFVMQRQRAVRLQLAAKEVLARANAELESQVQQRTQALVDTNQRLRETQEIVVHSAKLAAIGQLAAGVTHELNQPLATIRMLSTNAGIFIARSQTDLATDNLLRVNDIVDRMGRLIGELKTFSRKSSKNLRSVKIAESIENSLQILAVKIRTTGATIQWQPPSETILVMADLARLDQVFVNLLSNAIDAVTGTENPVVNIIVRRDADCVAVDICDNGIGLSEDVVVHLFEPFFTTKEPGAGLGLGLAISIEIVREFGGTLRAKNRPEGGSQFTVRLAILKL